MEAFTDRVHTLHWQVSGWQFEVSVDGKDADIKAVGEAPEAFTVSSWQQIHHSNSITVVDVRN